MQTYMIEFERVGRNHSVGRLTVEVECEADLARKIRNYVRPHIRSREFDVMIDMEAGAGWLSCGMHSGGNFSITAR